MIKMSHVTIVMALVITATTYAAAQEIKIGDLLIEHPWSRATPTGAKVGAGYLVITNKGSAADKLTGGSTSAAGRLEIHEMSMKGGIMTMRPVTDGLTIEPGKSVTFAPGGYHLMFNELKAPLRRGDSVTATLEFEKAGKVDVTFDILAVGAKGPMAGHSEHKM